MKLDKILLGDEVLPKEMRGIPNVNYERLPDLVKEITYLNDQNVPLPADQRFIVAYIDEVSNQLTYISGTTPLAVRRHAFIEAARSTNTVAIYVVDDEWDVVRLSFWEHWGGRGYTGEAK